MFVLTLLVCCNILQEFILFALVFVHFPRTISSNFSVTKGRQKWNLASKFPCGFHEDVLIRLGSLMSGDNAGTYSSLS